MPTQERNPMAVRECVHRAASSLSIADQEKGRPEENPSNNIASVLGRK
jgi:hypothetical protein